MPEGTTHNSSIKFNMADKIHRRTLCHGVASSKAKNNSQDTKKQNTDIVHSFYHKFPTRYLTTFVRIRKSTGKPTSDQKRNTTPMPLPMQRSVGNSRMVLGIDLSVEGTRWRRLGNANRESVEDRARPFPFMFPITCSLGSIHVPLALEEPITCPLGPLLVSSLSLFIVHDETYLYSKPI